MMQILQNTKNSRKSLFPYYKSFIGYNDDKNFKPLLIMLPKMSEQARNFDETNSLSF